MPVASASTLAVVEPVSRSPLSRQDQASCQKDLTNWLPTVIPNLDWQRDAIAYAIEQPAYVDVSELIVRPTASAF